MSIFIQHQFFGEMPMDPSRREDYWFLEEEEFGVQEEEKHDEQPFDTLRRCIVIDSLEECSICREEYEDGEIQVILPCNHAFHEACCIEWLKKQSTCPFDRKSVQ